MPLKLLIGSLSAGVALLTVGGAWAHGELVTTDPAAGERVRKAPAEISVTLSEPPTRDVQFNVKDGCGRTPLRGLAVEKDTIVASIGQGQPGKWNVRYRAISSVDGHVTAERFSFTVRGEQDCTPDPTEEPTESGGDDDDDGLAGPTTPAGDDGDSLPIMPIALGAGGLVLVGVLVRVFSAR